MSPSKDRNSHTQRGFTLIELALVIVIIAIAYTLASVSFGVVSYWHEESFLRKLTGTFNFLYHQAVSDQAYYQIEFDLNDRVYRVGVLRPEAEDAAWLQTVGQDAGTLSLELAALLNPSPGGTYTVIPPPDYPSLAEAIPLPEEMLIEDIRTMRGKTLGSEGGKVYVLFSPRGFAEFAVLHFLTSSKKSVTVLVNPFTGTTELLREYKDYEWTYGKKKRGDES